MKNFPFWFSHASRVIAALLSAASLLFFVAGCTSFDAPPKANLPAAVESVLPDPTAPIWIQFSEPVNPETFNLKVVRFETDPEGQLFDEDGDDTTELDVLFERSITETDLGGIGTLDESRTNYTIELLTTLPVGAPLAIIVEPGLQDDKGNEWKVRQLVNFSVAFSCGNQAPTNFPPASVHYMLVQVEEPIGTQLAIMADLRVDPNTGSLVGVFTDADRDPSIDCGQFGLTCDSATEVCRTLPTPECVPPSEAAATADEYPDYLPSPTPPDGFNFTAFGCIEDQEDGSFSFGNAPVDVEVTTPKVTVVAIAINASFRYDSNNVLRADGSFSATETLLGISSSGPASGTVLIRNIPDAEVKPGIPTPPPPESSAAN